MHSIPNEFHVVPRVPTPMTTEALAANTCAHNELLYTQTYMYMQSYMKIQCTTCMSTHIHVHVWLAIRLEAKGVQKDDQQLANRVTSL